MKLSLKLILFIWLGLFLIVAGLFYSAYSRLKPETFVTLVKEQIEKNYPGASLTVGEIDYSMAVDFSLSMKNLVLTRSGKMLGSIGDMEVKIPWWLLLLNKGNAHVSISGLDIYVDHDEKMPDPVAMAEKKKSREIRVVLPHYLAEARYTIKAKNISVRDSENTRRYFRLSKLLVREFQYGKNSAFELNIPIEINHRGSQYVSDLWLFGDLTPERDSWKMNYRGEFKTREAQDKLQLEDLIIDGKASFSPSQMNVESKLELLIEKSPVGEGSFTANDNNFVVDLKLQKFPLSFLEIIQQDVKNPFLTEIVGTSNGSLKIIKNSDKEFAELKGRLSFDGKINLGDTIVNGVWQLTVDGSKWETSFISPKGEVSFFRRSLIDFTIGLVTQYNEEIGFSGLDFKTASHTLLSLGSLMNDPASVYFNSSVSYKKCTLFQKEVDGEVNYGITPDRRFYTSTFTGENLSLNMNYMDKNSSHQIAIEAKNFPVHESFMMMSPFFMANNGIVNGKIEGKWGPKWTDGVWVSSLDFSEMIGAKGPVAETVQKIAQTFNIDPSVVTHQVWNGNFKNQSMTLTPVLFDGTDPAKITGSFSYKPAQKSYLVLTYPKNRTWKPVKKELPEPFLLNEVSP